MWGYGGYPQQYGGAQPGYAQPYGQFVQQPGFGGFPQQQFAQPAARQITVVPSKSGSPNSSSDPSPLQSPTAKTSAAAVPTTPKTGAGGSGPPAKNHPSTRNPMPQQPGTTVKLGVAFPASSPVDPGDKGRLINGKWRGIKVIGEGAFGKVRLAHHKDDDDNEVAIKTYNLAKLQPIEKERIQREIAALRILKHPNIIRLVEVIEERNQKIYLVLSLARGGDLLDYVNEKGVLPESEARLFFKKVALALEHCHENQIVHRDLKLENVLLSEDDKECFLTDFGLSNSLVGTPNEMLKTVCGTPIYRPPEMLKDQAYSPAVDVWALGVMLYAMLHGMFPFYETSLPKLFQLILAGKYPTPTEGSANAHDLIRRLLEPDPKKRITIADVKKHAFWSMDDKTDEPLPERRVSVLFRVTDDGRRERRTNEAGSRVSIRRHTLGRKSMRAQNEAQRAVMEAREEALKKALAEGKEIKERKPRKPAPEVVEKAAEADAHEGEHPAISIED